MSLNLRGADLTGLDLTNATANYLDGADLRDVDLTDTDLTKFTLKGALYNSKTKGKFSDTQKNAMILKREGPIKKTDGTNLSAKATCTYENLEAGTLTSSDIS
jgi:uncharacterized protein YjbI with pentapeptide repeats